MISKILRKNTSVGRIAGFVVSNFIGLAIVLGALQFYNDARSIWSDQDSFLSTDYLVLNKRVTSGNLLGTGSSSFSDAEIADLQAQPWVRSVGHFTANDFSVRAGIRQGDRGMSTYMFFESIPDDFIDVPRGQWQYTPGSDVVPIILSKDYLTLYNFGFASSAGLPQLSEGLMSSIPLSLTLSSEDGMRVRHVTGRVAGFSSRLNTILVPDAFMQEANAALGSGRKQEPSRLIIDVSSPGDVAIDRYLDEHDLEVAGDKSASQATFMLRLVTGIVIAIGALITLLSLFILVLSVSLIMERNRDKLHTLLMLGYPGGRIASPYNRLVAWATCGATLLAFGAVFLLRSFYLEPIRAMGANTATVWQMVCAGVALCAVIICVNLWSIRRRVIQSFRG